jgi:hypothetical protein
MFSSFIQKNMLHALDSCQIYHKNKGLNKGLSELQYQSLLAKPLFQEIDSRYQAKGLSEWGGLAWFIAETLHNYLQKGQSANPLTEPERLFVIKLTYVSQIISEQIDTLQLSAADKEMVEKAVDYSMEWAGARLENLAPEMRASLKFNY